MINKIKAILSIVISITKEMTQKANDNFKKEQIERKQKKLEEQEKLRQQKQIMQLQQIKQNQIATMQWLNKELCSLIADTLNALPQHMRISTIHTNPLAINNSLNNNIWTSRVHYDEQNVYSRISLLHLRNKMQEILDNQFTNGKRTFDNYITKDRTQISLGANYQILNNLTHLYVGFYNNHFGTLLHCIIFNLYTDEVELVIEYKIDSIQLLNYYHFSNYFQLIGLC